VPKGNPAVWCNPMNGAAHRGRDDKGCG
jgi:hypothetical protein